MKRHLNVQNAQKNFQEKKIAADIRKPKPGKLSIGLHVHLLTGSNTLNTMVDQEKMTDTENKCENWIQA